MGGILCDDIMSKRSKIWKSIIQYYTLVQREINLDFVLASVVLAMTLD